MLYDKVRFGTVQAALKNTSRDGKKHFQVLAGTVRYYQILSVAGR